MESKTILILANHIGGLYYFRGELVQELIESGYEVHFCVPQLQDDLRVGALEDFGAVYHHSQMSRNGMSIPKDLRLMIHYYKLMRHIQPAVVLTYTIKPNVYGSIASRLLGIPALINVTGTGTLLTEHPLFFKLLYGSACKSATTVFFQNMANQDLFMASHLVHERKARLIPGSGVNLEKFEYKPKVSEGNVVFIFISRIMKSKGIDLYLECAKRILSQRDDVSFMIVGPVEEAIYKEKIENLQKGMVYHGYSMDVRKELALAECLIHPTYYPEGMSNVLLEAGASGKNLIASKIPGCFEIIDNDEQGMLFEPKNVDALVECVHSYLEMKEEERLEMSSKLYTHISNNFDRDIVIGAYLEEITKVCGKDCN